MSKMMIHIKDAYTLQNHTILIDDKVHVLTFIEGICQRWKLPLTNYDHQLYSIVGKGVLEQSKTLEENQVINGDSLILI